MTTLTSVGPRTPRVLPPGKDVRIVLIDGFGQPAGSKVTHDVASALTDAYPQAEVLPPIATAVTLSDDTTLQNSFDDQAMDLCEVLALDDRETYIYAHSQASFPVAAVLGAGRYPHVAGVMFVGIPLLASREAARIEALDISDMGGVFGYVNDQLPDEVNLAGVVRCKRDDGEPLYVGISEEYASSFPSNHLYYRNLNAVASVYPTLLVSLGEEIVTDCVPIRAAKFANRFEMPFANSFDELIPGVRHQAVVIPGAPHRLGKMHRTRTVPRLFELCTPLSKYASTPG